MPLGHCQHLDFSVQPVPKPALLGFQVVLRLKVQPKSLGRGKIARQSESSIRGDNALATDNLINASGRHADILGPDTSGLIAKGFRNSSSRTSPGCTGATFTLDIGLFP